MAGEEKSQPAPKGPATVTKVLDDYAVSTEFAILFENLTLGELRAFTEMAIALGCELEDDVYEYFKDPENTYNGPDGLRIFANIRGSDLRHFDV